MGCIQVTGFDVFIGLSYLLIYIVRHLISKQSTENSKQTGGYNRQLFCLLLTVYC